MVAAPAAASVARACVSYVRALYPYNILFSVGCYWIVIWFLSKSEITKKNTFNGLAYRIAHLFMSEFAGECEQMCSLIVPNRQAISIFNSIQFNSFSLSISCIEFVMCVRNFFFVCLQFPLLNWSANGFLIACLTSQLWFYQFELNTYTQRFACQNSVGLVFFSSNFYLPIWLKMYS